jgi:MFS family permease
VWSLLASNPAFRRVWGAQLISFAGDWINSVALLDLLLKLTGNGMMVSLLLVANMLPLFLLMPIAGVVADRYDRRAIMIATNLAQALLALGFLLVHTAGQIWMIYLFSVGLVACEAFFAPASGAAIPNIVRPRHLRAANALAGSSWGTMVAVGSAIGGMVAARWGRDAAFILNSASFVLAAVLVMTVRVPFSAARGRPSEGPADGDAGSLPESAVATRSPERRASSVKRALGSAWDDFHEGLRYGLHRRPVLALLLVKTLWGLGGGVIALLSVIPVEVLHAGAAGIGILYASRGVGALLGPLLANAVVRDHPRRMAITGALGVVVSGLFYAGFAISPGMGWAAAFVFLAHLGGGSQWVLTSTLLQRTVADRMLGRISSLDLGGMTLTMTVSNLVCGWGIHSAAVGPRVTGLAAGILLVVLGLAWIAWFGYLRPPDFDHRDRESLG